MSTRIQSYIEGQSQFDDCKQDILKKMTKIKKKIDKIQEEQEIEHQQQMTNFIVKFKKDLRFILSEFDTLQKVLQKLGKQVYEKHELSKQMLMNTIRQQMRRFHHLIPNHIQEQMAKSKIRESSNTKAQQSQSDHPQPHTHKDNSKIENLPTSQEQSRQKQYQVLIANLNQFLIRNEQEELKQQEIQQQWRNTDSIQLKYHMSQLRRTNQEMQQRQRYNQFIRKEKIRQGRTPAKIAGKVLLCLFIVLIIFVVLASVVVYRVVKAIAGQL